MVDAPNTVWAADITYIWTMEGWLYLASVIDLYSRKIVGWSIGTDMKKELPLAALKQAILLREPDEGLSITPTVVRNIVRRTIRFC